MGDWNRDTTAILQQLWVQGRLAAEIASTINQRCGTCFTSRAIVSKAHRMRLPGRVRFPHGHGAGPGGWWRGERYTASVKA